MPNRDNDDEPVSNDSRRIAILEAELRAAAENTKLRIAKIEGEHTSQFKLISYQIQALEVNIGSRIQSQLELILNEQKKTNGRITKLEDKTVAEIAVKVVELEKTNTQWTSQKSTMVLFCLIIWEVGKTLAELFTKGHSL